jgi:GxxExxY protein
VSQISQTDERDPRTYAIIGAAMEVHATLGAGFLEAVYHEALAIEFQARAVPAQSQVEVPVYYKGRLLGTPYRADFLCFGDVVVELKAKRDLNEADRTQVVHYLKATGKNVGLLLNFGEPSLDFQRFVFRHGPKSESEKSA